MNIEIDKLEAEEAYIGAKKTIEEIKEIQKRIEKLFNEIRDLCFGFKPSPIIQARFEPKEGTEF